MARVRRDRVSARAFFAAVRAGELAVVSRYFDQVDVRTEVQRLNARARALPVYVSTEHIWFESVLHGDFVFSTIVEHGHIEMLEWFFSQEMFYHTVLVLTAHIGLAILEKTTSQAREMLEIVLGSHQFTVSMGHEQRQNVLAELLSAATAASTDSWIEPLIAHGADPNQSYAYVTPLFAATEHGTGSTIRRLASNGAFVSQAGLITQAVFESNTNVVRELLKLGADPRSVIADHPPALLFAVEQRLTPIVALLITEGMVDLEPPVEGGRTPLMYAVHDKLKLGHERSTEIVTLLINLNADLNAVDSEGSTVLHWASRSDDVALFRMVLERGCDPNRQNLDGLTPLIELTECKLNKTVEQMIDLLLQCGADPYITTSTGKSAITVLQRKAEGRRFLASREQFFRRDSESTEAGRVPTQRGPLS